MSEYIGAYAQRLALADRVRRLGRDRGGAARTRRRSSSTGATRAGARPGRREAVRVPVVPRDQPGAMARRERGRGRADRLRRLAALARAGPRRRQGAGGSGAELVRGRGQPDRRGVGRPARALDRARAGPRRAHSPAARAPTSAPKSPTGSRPREARRGGDQRARFGRLAAQHARRRRRAHAGGAVLRHRPRRRHRRAVHRAEKVTPEAGAAPRQRGANPPARGVRRRARRARRQDASRSIPNAAWRRSSPRSRARAPSRSRCAIRRSCPRRSRTRSSRPATAPRRRATARRCAGSSTGCRSKAPKGGLDELAAAARLHAVPRRGRGDLRDLSFDTISGAGPQRRDRPLPGRRGQQPPLAPGSIYLFDSGGQYLDGTTDITRTVWIGPGEPPAEQRTASPACSRATSRWPAQTFPQGTVGAQLDAFARQSAVGGRARLRARHRPRGRQLPRGPRRAAADRQGARRPGRHRPGAAARG